MPHPAPTPDVAAPRRSPGAIPASAAAALALAVAAPAPATDFDWLGETGNWSDKARWDGGGFPNDPADSASIENNKVPPFTVTLDGDYTINWLFMGTKVGTLVATDRILAMSGTGSASLQIGTVEWTDSTLSTEVGGSIFLGSGIDFTVKGVCNLDSPLVDVDGLVEIVGTASDAAHLIASDRLEIGGQVTMRATASVAQSLTVTAGPLVNEANGLIHVQNTGLSASLDTDLFDNRGTLDLDKNASITRVAGALDNRGDIAIATNQILEMEAGGQLFTQRVGSSLDNLGTFSLAAGRFEFEGGALTGNPLELGDCELDLATDNAGAFTLFGQTDLTGPIAESQTLDVVSTADDVANLVGATGIDNHGTVITRATASAPKSLTATTGAIVNHPTGLIHARNTGAGTRIDADLLDNRGTLDLDVNTRIMRADSAVDNRGAISTATSRNLFLEAGGQLFTQRVGSSLDSLGTFSLAAGRFEFEGGALTGNPLELGDCELDLATDNAGAFTLFGQTDLTGPIAESQTLDVVSTADDVANLVGATGIDNHGTVITRATASAPKSLTATTGAIVNHPTGLIHARNTGAGTRIDADLLDNRGTLDLDVNTRIMRADSAVDNRGAISTATSRNLFLEAGGQLFTQRAGSSLDNPGKVAVANGRFEFEGGTLIGNPPELTDCELDITTDNAGAFTLFGQTDLTGPIAESQTVDVVSTANDIGHLVGADGVDNHGAINLRATASTEQTISATTGAIVNHPTGVIDARSIGLRSNIDADLFDNRGTLLVNKETRLVRPGGTVTNRGLLRVATSRRLLAGTTTFTNDDDGVIDGTGTVDLEGADFTNNAFVEPGTSAGQLRFDGLYRQSEIGTLVIELGGTGQGTQFDHLRIDGDAELAGNLEIRLINDFVPTLGQQFTFLTTTGLISGEFENVNCQQIFRLDYTKSSVTITLVQQTCPADLNCSGTVGFNDLLSVLTNWGPYENCPPYRPQDFDEDCDVGFSDLLVILNAWGPCP